MTSAHPSRAESGDTTPQSVSPHPLTAVTSPLSDSGQLRAGSVQRDFLLGPDGCARVSRMSADMFDMAIDPRFVEPLRIIMRPRDCLALEAQKREQFKAEEAEKIGHCATCGAGLNTYAFAHCAFHGCPHGMRI